MANVALIQNIANPITLHRAQSHISSCIAYFESPSIMIKNVDKLTPVRYIDIGNQ